MTAEALLGIDWKSARREMSVVHVRHIERTLQNVFAGLIDMSDYAQKSRKEQEDALLSRCQAAYALTMLTGISPQAAAVAVTDGFDDNGIDALYYDQDEKILYTVQSKWHGRGSGSLELGDMHKYVQGVKDLIDANFSPFGAKIRARKAEILSALDETTIRFIFIVVHTGTQKISSVVNRPLAEVIDSVNDPTVVASSHVITQAELHNSVAAQAEGASIKIDVMLHEWGQSKHPYSSYYGQVEAEDIAKWWTQHGQLLFTRNLRKFAGRTDVNDSITDTLISEPSKFWYFNNGITVLCNSLQKKAMGGSKRSSGVFHCEGISIVNGAQTVGCIGDVYKTHPQAVQQARVNIRFISIGNAPESLANDLTRAANTQNRIERRDFAALDPEQDRLRRDLWLDLNKNYVYKSGDTKPAPEDGCDIEESTIALACAYPDPSLAVQAKREVGKLWEDVTRSPYRQLFNPSVNAVRMWRAVEIMRVVDAVLKDESAKRTGRERLVAVHGNRLILHLVFRQLSLENADDPNVDMEPMKQDVKAHARIVLSTAIEGFNDNFQNSYPNSLFKNASKCRDLVDHCVKELASRS